MVSELGLGAMDTPTSNEGLDTLTTAIDNGIDFVDTAREYYGSEYLIGQAFTKRHKSAVYISTKTFSRTKDGAQYEIDKSLRTLGVTKIHVYQLHDVSTWETWNQVTKNNGALEGLKIAQARGLIDHIGISSHDLSILEKAIISGLFETVMLEYSAFYNKTYHLINKAKERDIGVIVMRPLGGSGRMSRLRNLMKSLDQPSEINSNILLQYVLSNPNISVVIPGCSYPSRIKENVQLALTYSPFSSAQQKYCENLALKFSKYG